MADRNFPEKKDALCGALAALSEESSFNTINTNKPCLARLDKTDYDAKRVLCVPDPVPTVDLCCKHAARPL